MNIFKYICVFTLFCLFLHENVRGASLSNEETIPSPSKPIFSGAWKSKSFAQNSSAINTEELNEVLRERRQRRGGESSFKLSGTNDEEDSEEESEGAPGAGAADELSPFHARRRSVSEASPLRRTALLEGLLAQEKSAPSTLRIKEGSPLSSPADVSKASEGKSAKKTPPKSPGTKITSHQKGFLSPTSSQLLDGMFIAEFNLAVRREKNQSNLMGSVFDSSKPLELGKKKGFLGLFWRKKQGPPDGTA